MATKRKAKAPRKTPKAGPARSRSRPPRSSTPMFVGRDASPVLERYPPKDPATLVKGPPAPLLAARAVPLPVAGAPAPKAPGSAAATAPISLISLERPFDVDDFAQMLGETSIRVTVPREDLVEVLRRIVDFMGFGIYVYRVAFWPAPSDLLKEFVVELQRVDYSASAGNWVPFVERGRSESPFGPDGNR